MSRASLKNVARLLDVENTPTDVASQFLADYKRSIELDSYEEYVPSKTFKPSSMQCMRNSYYQLSGIATDNSGSTYNLTGIVNSGSDIHERTQGYIEGMKANGIDCEYVDVGKYVLGHNLENIEVRDKRGMETKLYNKLYNISFMCDGIIRYHGKYYILEIKTETCSKWYARKGVDPKHFNQAITYSLSLGIDSVIFLYISRDMLDTKAYMFNVTGDMQDGIVKYINTVNDYLKSGVVPPKDKDIPRNVCAYCGYKRQCKLDK